MTSSFVDRSRGLEGLPLFGALVGAGEEVSPESGRVSPEAGAKVEATEKDLTESLKGASSRPSKRPLTGGGKMLSLCGEAFQDEGEDELFNGLWPEIWASLKRWEAYMKERDPEWLKAFLSVDPE